MPMDKTEGAAVAPSGRRVCPKCGTEMNRHAEKIDFGAAGGRTDPVFGGVLAEFHTCPNPRCKYVLELFAG
jgi:hypothetical protein